MELIKQTLQNFSELLASTKPVPGGGSGSALEAALGISLITMAAGITANKTDYAHRKGEMQYIIGEADILRRWLLILVDEDAAAYNQIMAARSMPKNTEAEAMQNALKAGVVAPYHIMSAALRGLDLAAQLAKEYYCPVASDVGFAVQSLKTAAQGADLTILSNLQAITDQSFVQAYQQRSQLLLDKIIVQADTLYTKVRSSLTRGIE